MPRLRDAVSLFARELVYRTCCRHRQGARPNIMLYCSRRGGSTWLLNTIAAHPGVRSIGRPFLSVMHSRWAGRMPDLAAAGRTQIIGFEGASEQRFLRLAEDVIGGRLPIHPTLAFRAPYFERKTDRIVLQMTSGTAMIEWFARHFDVLNVLLFRHPIPTAMSIAHEGWPPECSDYLGHARFVDEHLDPAQVALAERLLAGDDALAIHVLDWSLKMLVPFRTIDRLVADPGAAPDGAPRGLALSYEQTIMAPEVAVERLATVLDLPDVGALRRQISEPSRNVTKTTAERLDDRSFLLRKWRAKIDVDRERELLAIPEAFGIDLYDPGRDLPRDGSIT